MKKELISRAEQVAAEERQRIAGLKDKLSSDAERRAQQEANIRQRFRGEIEKKLTGDADLAKEAADEGLNVEQLAMLLINAILDEGVLEVGGDEKRDDAPRVKIDVSPKPKTEERAIDLAKIKEDLEKLKKELGGQMGEVVQLLEKVVRLLENYPAPRPEGAQQRINAIIGQISVDEVEMVENGVGAQVELMKRVIGEIEKAVVIKKVEVVREASADAQSSGKEFEPEPLPEHLDRGSLVEHYFKQFEKALEFGDEVAYEYLIKEANGAMTRFLDSGSAQGSSDYGKRFLAMWDVLKDFNPDKIDAKKSRNIRIRAWGNKVSENETDEILIRRHELARKLTDKGLEILFLSYIAEFAIKHGTPKSLVSDWSHLLEMEKADTDNFGSGVDMFDFFLSDSEQVEHGRYKHSNIFTYLMWELPNLIREVEKEVGRPWDDGYPVDHADSLDKMIKKTISDLRSEVLKSDTVTKTVKQHRSPGGARGRWGTEDVKFTFTKRDFLELNDNDVEFDHIKKYISLFGTATGVRQHLFINDLARGSTPGGAMSDNKDWMVKCSRFALANYQCYKGAIPHPLTEGFEVSWTHAGGKPDSKQIVIVSSILQTEAVLDRVMRVRKERVNLGTLNNDIDYPLETSYPDLYSFIVRAHQKRTLGEIVYDESGQIIFEDKNGQRLPKRGKKKPAKFEAFVAGLNAVDDFVTQALKVPGGVSDKEKIKSMKPAELRSAMLKDLVDLIQKKVSPMKSNQSWVNWRHVCQYILMFVDRMYRVYKLCDDTPDGRAIFTHQIRQTFVSESYNLAGIDGPWIKENGTKPAVEFARGQAVEAAGLKRKFSGDNRFAGVWEAGHQAVTAETAKIDLRDWILSRLPELDQHWSVSIGPKERPLYGRIVGQIAGPQEDRDTSVQRVRGPVGSAFEKRGVLALDNIMHNGSDAFTNLWYDFVNVGAIPNFQKGIWQVVIGTPAEEQKKVADEKK